jgi:ABC-2 type transport system ATP-binding protein
MACSSLPAKKSPACASTGRSTLAPVRRGRQCALVAAFALLASLAGAGPAGAADPGYTKTGYSVPVTQHDELGQPVSLDTDVYLPGRNPPAGGFPLIELFHGGGSDKANPYDAGHAAFFARHGYVVVIYSARGHGSSGGQTSCCGPKEIHDLFDVAAWALGIGGRNRPAHPSFHIDRTRIGLTGYSQGGLHTNLGQAWAGDPSLDPYGIRFRVLEPGNTPDYVYNALAPNGVVKLSIGVGLVETYLVGAHAHVSPLIAKWIAALATQQPVLAGGELCKYAGHDTPTSTTKQDLAFRSPGCFASRMTAPSLWAQAFDDTVFPPGMAISMWRRMPNPGNRLYLDMGGHAAPSAPDAVEADKLREQLAFFDHYLRGMPLHAPEVVYWTRDPGVQVPSDSYRYPDGAWARHTAPTWPPPRTERATYELGADGRAVAGGAEEGALPLAPLAEDEANDPIALAALSGTPLGTSPIPSRVPATNLPGSIAGFETQAFSRGRELDGAARATLAWTPASPDTQLVLEVFDEAPDGTLTLLGRGVQGLRGATPGTPVAVKIDANAFSARVRAGHRILTWVMAANPLFYDPYPDSLGGTLQAGSGSTLSLPLR